MSSYCPHARREPARHTDARRATGEVPAIRMAGWFFRGPGPPKGPGPFLHDHQAIDDLRWADDPRWKTRHPSAGEVLVVTRPSGPGRPSAMSVYGSTAVSRNPDVQHALVPQPPTIADRHVARCPSGVRPRDKAESCS